MTRESEMVVIERDADGKPTIWCDPEIVDLVTALNADGLKTLASCSGHGHRPGFIAMADGRWLFVATERERHTIDAAFPLDINGEPTEAALNAGERLRDLIGQYYDLGYAEGVTQRSVDTAAGEAQVAWSEIDATITTLERQLATAREALEKIDAELADHGYVRRGTVRRAIAAALTPGVSDAE